MSADKKAKQIAIVKQLEKDVASCHARFEQCRTAYKLADGNYSIALRELPKAVNKLKDAKEALVSIVLKGV